MDAVVSRVERADWEPVRVSESQRAEKVKTIDFTVLRRPLWLELPQSAMNT